MRSKTDRALSDGCITTEFEALPEFPDNNGMPLTDDLLEMLDAVAEVAGDVRPDIAEMIRTKPGRSWTWRQGRSSKMPAGT